MPLHLTTDDFGNAMPVVRRTGVCHAVDVNANHAEISFAQTTKLISFWGTGQFHVAFGDSSVVAISASDAVPAGFVDYEPLVTVDGAILTHMSIFAAENVTVYVSERA